MGLVDYVVPGLRGYSKCCTRLAGLHRNLVGVGSGMRLNMARGRFGSEKEETREAGGQYRSRSVSPVSNSHD